MILEVNLHWKSILNESSARKEIFNFKDIEGFDRFFHLTDSNEALRHCFDENNKDIENLAKIWLNMVKNLIKKSFKKVKIKKSNMKPS